jgi:ATP-dependent Lhr-like helicase
LPDAFLQPAEDPLVDLVGRYARRHIPFRQKDVAQRFGLGLGPIRAALTELARVGRIVEGEFLPGQRGREWCDAEVLRQLKRRSLARLREQVEPVEQAALGRFLVNWQGISQPRRGLDGLLDVVEQLQGLALPASDWERFILPARIVDFRPSDLDELCASGEVLWQGAGGLGAEDGRIAFYLTDHFASLSEPCTAVEGELEAQIRAVLNERNAIFFDDLARRIGGFRNDLVDALWRMVWAGEVTNDTLMPLRSLRRQKESARKSPRGRRAFRSRRVAKEPGTEGRWSLLQQALRTSATATQQEMSRATQLIERYGVVTREMVASEGLAGGFSRIYPVFKAMEEAGRIRRGYFVAGLGAAQFAAPGADDRLREQPPPEDTPKPLILAATDPANPYGAALPWPERSDEARPARSAGARVILLDGHLIGYLNRSGQQLLTYLPAEEPQRTAVQSALVEALSSLATDRSPALLSMIDKLGPTASTFTKRLEAAGFVSTSRGLLHRRRGA